MKIFILIIFLLTPSCCIPGKWTDKEPTKSDPSTDNMTIEDSIKIDIFID